MFVDIRYPGEFASGHLPDAINLAVRPMPTEVMNEQLAQAAEAADHRALLRPPRLLLRRGARP